MRRQFFSVATCVLLLAGFAPAASAQTTNAPPGNSGVDQYLETVPEASGNRAPGKRDSSPLSARTEAQLKQAGAQGEAVSKLVATTGTTGGRRSGSGSKSGDKAKAGKGNSASPRRSTSRPSTSVPGTVAAPTLGGSGSGGMGILLPVLLVLSTAAAVAVAVFRRRRQS
jgi:hypothetical protein